MRFAKRLAAAILTLVVLALPAVAREEIRAFTSNLVLSTDGSVTVTEILDVNAEGIEIRRGIYRDIPVVMQDKDGTRVRPDLDVISVTRDQQPEPFRTERMGNFIRIWIGDPEVFLNRGVHRYAITYAMTRMGRFFADHDEIYWNATGNYWNFPILAAIATVNLPDGAVISDISGYTGPVGSNARDVTIAQKSGYQASIRSNVALAPGEGLTYAVSFQKGILVPPSAATQALYWLSDRQDLIVPGLGALLTLLYFTLSWMRVGRDPKKGTIIPLFHPPKDVSPGLAHYIANWGWKNAGWTAFTAAIFNLGVKGLVRIDNSGDLDVKPTGRQPEAALPPGEGVIFDYVNAQSGFTINKTTGPTLNTKRGEFTSAVQTGNGEVWFRNNVGYTFFGVLLGAAMLAIMVFFGYLDPLWLIGAVVAGVVLGIFGTAGRQLLSGPILGRLFSLIWIIVIGANVAGGAFASLGNVEFNSAAVAAVSIVAVSILFAVLMRAPSVPGRRMMDQLDGFKLYLETAEKNRLNMDKAPPMTVERFERILPYAIALGVERPWSQHFEAELARHAVEGVSSAGYTPLWYSGRDFSSDRIASTIGAAASSMSAAMVAAQPVQSSSSGSGGGGSSGGGGGGGGGGGW